MSLALKKIKAYSKLGLMVAIALLIVLIVVQNRKHNARFWFFHTYENVNVLWLLVCTAAGSIVSYWIFRTIFSLWRDMRALGREAHYRDQEERQKQVARDLEEQERRIDQKRAEMIRDE